MNARVRMRSIAAALMFLLAGLLRDAGAADIVCVQSNQDFADALVLAQSLPRDIRIKQGTYNLDGSIWDASTRFAFLGGTSLRGGYTANCAGRQVQAGNTVLTGTNGPYQLYLTGDLTLEGLTLSFANGLTISVSNEDGDPPFAPGAQLLIYRSEITGMSTSAAPLEVLWYADPDFGGAITIADTLVVNNTAGASFCALYFGVTNAAAPLIFLTNNTVVANNGGGVCMRNHYSDDGNGVLFVHDNILWGNTGTDLSADTPNLEIVDNTIAGEDHPTASNTTETNTRTGDPKLDANFRPIVSPLSPVINKGESDSGNLPATDLDGGPRVVGSRVDQGAYESSIDDNFLLTVTTALDDVPAPAGSLRAAIESANAQSGGGEIRFDIGSDCGPKVITLVEPLPQITKPIIFYGYTQTGAAKNTLDVGDNSVVCIVLDGATHAVASGLTVAADAPANAVLDVQGLAFGGFTFAAIDLDGNGGHNVVGNRIGGATGGVALQPSGYGVYIGSSVTHVFVGGEDPANRNIIAEALSDGILVDAQQGQSAASGNSIVNNYVGVGWNIASSTYVNRGNAIKGIRVRGSNNEISGNLVGYNGNDGIDLDGTFATGNVVENNAIGSDDGNTDLGNGSMGVRVENGGHDNVIRLNTIAQNAGTGVRIVTGLANTIRRNKIRDNGSYGIDLGSGGIDPIDNDDAIGAQLLANRGLNYPVISIATGTAHGGVVTGGLTTTSGDYVIDVYSSPACDGSGYGEGARWLGSRVITRASAGGLPTPFRVPFALAAPASIAFGAAITVTASDAAGNAFPGNTSEFSACVNYTNDVIFANGFN